MKNLWTLILLCAVINGFSQKISVSDHKKWLFDAIAYTSDSTGVAKLYYAEKRSGVAFVSQDGTIQKELPIPGMLQHLASWKGKVIAFCRDGWDWSKDIHALLIDPKTMSIIADQLIFHNETGHWIEAAPVCNENKELRYFLIQTTGQKGNVGKEISWKEHNALQTVVALSAVYFSNDFKPIPVTLNAKALGADLFFGAFAGTNGEIGLVSYSKGVLTAEKFGRKGESQGTLTTEFEYSLSYWDRDQSFRARFDPNNGNTLVVSLANPDARNKHRNLGSFVFDFAAGKVITLESIKLNSDYYKSFRDDPRLVKTKNFKDIEDFRPADLVFLGDTIVLTKEIRYEEVDMSAQSAHSHWYSNGAIMSFYDRQFRLLRQVYLNKHFEIFLDTGRGLSFHVQKGKIYAYAMIDAGVAKFGNVCFVIDPVTFSVETRSPEWGEVTRGAPTDLPTLFWFRDYWLENRSTDWFMFGEHVGSYLVAAAYP